jgi:hypothetical protein
MLQTELFAKYLKPSLVSGATCLTFLLSISFGIVPAIAKTPTSLFGLGLEGMSGKAGGAARCPADKIGNAIAPEDGGRTLSARPTFYVYVENLYDSQERPYRAALIVRDGIGLEARATYRAFSRSKKLGLIKFTLPDSAPVLEVGKDIRWQVRLAFGEFSTASMMNVNSLIRLEPNAVAGEAIHKARTNLEKARIYARYYYWYDAFDAYTQWLDANPNDRIARQERSAMMLYAQVATASEKRKCALVSDIPLDRIESQKSESLQLSPNR